MRTCVFDIETHDLSAPFGPLLCASVLDLSTGEMRTFRQDTYMRRRKNAATSMIDDRQLLLDFRDYLETFHVSMGWYTKGFDIPHIRSRLVLHNERPLKEMMHVDGVWYFKGWRGLKFGSAKLGKVAANLKTPNQKPEVTPDVWMGAKAGDRTCMDEVCDRCEADVSTTHDVISRALDLGLIKNIQRY